MKKKISIAAVISLISLIANAQTYEDFVSAGNNAAAHDSLSKAEQLYKSALRLAPQDYRNPLVYNNLAKVQQAQGLNDRALTSYELALNLAPQNVPILMNRANLYLLLGNQSKALIDYRKVIDVDPNNTDALQYIGYIFTKQHEFAKAKIHYERLLTIDPENYAGQLGVAILFQECGKPGDALARLTLLSEKYPDKAEIYSVKAEIEAEAQQPELAIMDLNKAISLEPNNKNFVLTRGFLHYNQKNYRLAKQDFEHAIELGVPRGQLKKELKECK
jgi:tetratricopeptide (TPR) repeat protein